MKHWFKWIIALSAAALFTVFLTFLWIKYNSYEETLVRGVPSVEYCELRKNPYEHDGKVVRLTTNLHWFMHGYFLFDANCQDKLTGSGTDESRTAILIYEKNREEIYENLNRFHNPGEIWKPIKITAVGRFQYKSNNWFSVSDSIEDRTSFHFEIYQVESASR